MPQCHIAGLVFDQIEHALNRFVRRLQPQQGDVDEVSHSALMLERLLNQLKWRAERKNAIDRLRLLNHHSPARRLKRRKRVKISAAFQVPGLSLGNLRRQTWLSCSSRSGIRPKIIREQRPSSLIDDLAGRLIGELNRRQSPSD